MKEGIFLKWSRSRLAYKNTIVWISERGDNKFYVFGTGMQKGGDMYYVVGWTTLWYNMSYKS